VCEAISHYSCDILLITGRPGCLPGVQALIRHLQPVPVNRIVWLDKYQVHEWYPFSQQGRIGNPKSTAAVGAMLCSLALDLRLPRFNFKAADIGAYSTVRYLGVLDNTVNTLREENVWYQDIDLDKPGAKLDARLHFPLRGNVTLGFRQLANALACHAALHAQHQLGRTGKSDCRRRRAERAAQTLRRQQAGRPGGLRAERCLAAGRHAGGA
jgi:hypothetical protein